MILFCAELKEVAVLFNMHKPTKRVKKNEESEEYVPRKNK